MTEILLKVVLNTITLTLTLIAALTWSLNLVKKGKWSLQFTEKYEWSLFIKFNILLLIKDILILLDKGIFK